MTIAPNQAIKKPVLEFSLPIRLFLNRKQEISSRIEISGTAENLKHHEVGLGIVGEAHCLHPVEEFKGLGWGFDRAEGLEEIGVGDRGRECRERRLKLT